MFAPLIVIQFKNYARFSENAQSAPFLKSTHINLGIKNQAKSLIAAIHLGVNELQHKESSDHHVETKIYTKEDQGKA